MRCLGLSIPSYYTASGQIIPIEFNHLSEKAIAHLIRDSYAMLCRPALQLMFSQRADGQHQSHQHSQRLDAPTFFRSTSEIAKFEPSRNWDLCSATLSHLYCARRASGERLSSLVAKKFIYTLEHYRIESNKNRQLQKQVMLFLHICRQLLRGGLGHSTIQKLLNQPAHIVIFMRYIVTGGAGFIGSNLADTLSQNHDVVIIDNLATGRRVNVEHLLDHPRVTFVEGSITDLDLLMEMFPGADGIFHQVAIPSVPRSVKNPLASNEANVTGMLRRNDGVREGCVYCTLWGARSP